MLQEFLKYLGEREDNGDIYVWGGQGEFASEDLIRRKETSARNIERAIKLLKKRIASGHKNIRAFDCSGLIMYFMQNLKGVLKSDMSANTLKSKCKIINKSDLLPGDFVFRIYTDTPQKGQAYHVGVVVDNDKNVIESKGRDDGVVKRPLNAQPGYWNYFGRPTFLESEIIKNAPSPAKPKPSAGWELSRLLKRTSPSMTGNDVRSAQQALISRGYSCGNSGADGSFGANTENAVRRFQSSNGIKADGIIGENTCAKLGGTWKDSSKVNATVSTWSLSRLLKRTVPITKGTDVKAVQSALISKGYSCGKSGADGQYGDGTKNAVIQFQRANGLTADGIVGRSTCIKLGGKWKG